MGVFRREKKKERGVARREKREHIEIEILVDIGQQPQSSLLIKSNIYINIFRQSVNALKIYIYEVRVYNRK